MYLDIVDNQPSFTLEKTQNKFKYCDSSGLENVNVLSGNVGYFRLSYFYPSAKEKEQVFNVLDKLSTTDALIIDLRDTEGESIAMAQYLMSFFVEEGTILS